MRAVALLCCVIGGCMVNAAGADVVIQRSGMAAIEGHITKLDDAGITIQRSTGAPDFVRWDMVREVITDHPDPSLDQRLKDADSLWRARTRLERNDTTLAEPLFERLFEKYRGQTNETALLVCEGLLRCRLARGANDAAVIPALETARLRRAISTASNIYNLLPPAIDDRTSLCPSLPPTWVVTSNLIKLERDLGGYNAGADTVVAGLALLYREAAAKELGIRSDGSHPVLAADHPGILILRAIVEIQDRDPTKRDAARKAMAANAAAKSGWEQAWSYYFLGLSQLNEPSESRSGFSSDEGQLNLAHVPAQFAAMQPYLAGLALAKLAIACETAGEAASAASLRSELAARFPHHPVLATMKNRPAAVQPVATSNSHQANTSKDSS